MTLSKVLLIFAFIVFTAFYFKATVWLLNQKSDYLLIVAGLLAPLYFTLAYRSNAFTKNPFKK